MKQLFAPVAVAVLALPATAPFSAARTAQESNHADPDASLQRRVAEAAKPMTIFVLGPDRGYGAAAGDADPSGRKLTPDTPLRIASNTKTFVAATVLRLWEQGRIDLDAPIASLIDPKLDALLKGDGYDTARITVRHLLSHSGGLYDHGSDKRFEELVMTDPGHQWTRASLIGLQVEWADPLGEPGAAFHYSDGDYILLGDMIERVTGKSLAAAVREQLGLDALGLRSTYWEVYEQPRPGAEPRAHQFLGGKDVTGVNASYDLYGGGGIVSSSRDLATFFKALFGGRVFTDPRTLLVMLSEGPQKDGDKYRYGIFVQHTPAGDVYWHSGFWGTYAAYSPTTGVAAAGMATHQSDFGAMMRLVNAQLTGKQ